ncbi:MAG: Adenylate cyclase 2 [Planctomycetota bacterium]
MTNNTTSNIRLQIYEGSRSLAVFEISRATEIGRRQADEPAPFAKLSLVDCDRIIVADRPETQVSRQHARFEPHGDDSVLVRNASTKNSLPLAGNLRLEPGESRILELPVTCEVGGKVVRLQLVPQEPLNLQTLQSATCAPGKSLLGRVSKRSLLPTVDLERGAWLDESFLFDWLQASMDVFQSAASSIEFLPKAARAAVELVSLDRAAVLLYQADRWSVASLQGPNGDLPADQWQPSQTMLRRVLEQQRTFFHVPAHDVAEAASLIHVQSLVAAPFLDLEGNVLGVIYGERSSNQGSAPVPAPVPASGNALGAAHGASQRADGRSPIRELDAKLVELLAYGVASGLARIEQERKLIAERVRFEQFFTPELARMLELRGDDMLAARDAEITVLFCDIKGFSRISANSGAAVAIEWVCDVLSELSDAVAEFQGVLVDYSGDALEAIWGAPLAAPEHATLACRAAMRMREKLPAVNARWRAKLGEETDIAIGLHSGAAQVGNIGSRRKYKYGALGTTVNLASRIQGATKYVGASLLASEATVRRADPSLAFRRLCTIRTVNIQEPVAICELCDKPTERWRTLTHDYESALRSFEQQQWEAARTTLAKLQSEFPEDEPAEILRNRMKSAESASPEFDSVWNLGGK